MNRLMLDKRLHGLRQERETLRADLRSGERLLASLTAQSDHVASAAAEGYLPRQQAAQKRDEVSAQESRLASARGALARVERVATLLRGTPGIAEARPLSEADLGKLLRPWLGDAAKQLALPLPAVIEVHLAGAGPDGDG